MDTSQMIVTNIDQTLGIKLGDDLAPVKVVEFINLRCPYCRKWFNDSKETYQTYIDAGKIQRIIKLFDKTKPGLDKGNIMHQYVPSAQEDDPLTVISEIYASQDDWGNLASFEDVAAYAETHLILQPVRDQATATAIVTEAAEANIVFVPTIIVGEQIFDQKISQEEFRKILDNA